MSPTVHRLEDLVNDNLPSPFMESFSVLRHPLCRCEHYKGVYYHGAIPYGLKKYATQNGIFIIPYKYCPAHRRLGEERELQGPYVFPCP